MRTLQRYSWQFYKVKTMRFNNLSVVMFVVIDLKKAIASNTT